MLHVPCCPTDSLMMRLNFRRFFGYGLLFAALWFVIGVFSFTFLPA
jgi:hypothetical protein